MIVGDSSGGNLALTVSMKLKELGIRLPDALLIVYPSTNVTTAASPSRVISAVDPILALGVMMACQQVRMSGKANTIRLIIFIFYPRLIAINFQLQKN